MVLWSSGVFGLLAQNTIWFQGFENASVTCTENWGYTGGVRNNQTSRTGNWSGMVGRAGTSHTMTFDDVDVSGLEDLNLQLFHRVRCGSGPGLDVREGAVIKVRLNAGPWVVIAQVGGFSDHCYLWTDIIGGAPTTSSGCNVYQASNPVNYSIPAGTNTVGLEIISIRADNCTGYNNRMENGGFASLYDRTDEGFHIDDVRITTSSTDFTCIWTGAVNDNWHNCLNWNNGLVPNATRNVIINQSGDVNTNCRVSTANATCNNLLLTTANSWTQDLEVRNNRTLNILGDVTITRTGNGVNNLKAEAQEGGTINVAGNLSATIGPGISFAAQIEVQAQNGGTWNIQGDVFLEKATPFGNPFVWISLKGPSPSTFRCNNLTLISNGANVTNTAFVQMVSNDNHLLEVQGDFLMMNNARFNMNNLPNPQARFAGDIINLVSAAQFQTNNSNIILDGSGIQEINTAGFALPFHNLTLNKSGGHVRLNNDITFTNAGVLALNNDYIDLNGNQMYVTNTAVDAITRISGAISEESGAGAGINEGRINWTINNVGGAHVFPFSRGVGGPYIPFVFERTAGNAGVVSISTYGTPPNNQPWPLLPDPVLNLNSTMGLLPDNQDATVDRFWQIDVSGTPTANITFHYAPDELPAAPFNDPASLRAQRYDTTQDIWLPGPLSQIAAGNSVQVVGATNFSPWTLASEMSPLPLEWLDFTARPDAFGVHLDWLTGSEQNTSHFEVQRSANARDFYNIGTLSAAGFSSQVLSYYWLDHLPMRGMNYYRIRQIDFDGAYTYSVVRAVLWEENQHDVSVYYADQTIRVFTDCELISRPVLYGISGQQISVKETGNSMFVTDVSLSSGVYVLVFHCDEETITAKFHVQ
ncbi:MAG: T9SS C-terminal target domain-containing protein [Cryomorphaceae bacterium]|nr:MAG: T9SS C-terminal target domain-containing protein [Cryomorphaceae bacterium]